MLLQRLNHHSKCELVLKERQTTRLKWTLSKSEHEPTVLTSTSHKIQRMEIQDAMAAELVEETALWPSLVAHNANRLETQNKHAAAS